MESSTMEHHASNSTSNINYTSSILKIPIIADPANKTGNISFGEDEVFDVPLGIVILLAFMYGSISLVAVVGNGLVILVIVKNRKMQTVTNIFIANLALADVMIGIFSIPFQFQAALLQRWVLPYFMCATAPFVTVLSVNISVFTLTVISIDRYVAVLYPLKAGFSKLFAAAVLAVIWIIGVVSCFPKALYFKVELIPQYSGEGKPFCSPHWPGTMPHFGKYYHLYLLIVQYLLPLIIINFSYFRIAFRIWGTKAPGQAVDRRDNLRTRNKKKVVKMLIIVVLLFVVCWMPLQIYNLLKEIYPKVNQYQYIHIIWFGSNWLAMSNSCYNPFIYGLLNEKFKREFRLLFKMCPCWKKEDQDLMDYSEDSIACRKFSIVVNNSMAYHSPNGRLSQAKRYSRMNTEITEHTVL